MTRRLSIVLLLMLTGCGSDSTKREVSSGYYSVVSPGEARNVRLEVALNGSGIPVDPCLGESPDGICFGLANPDCEAAHVVAGECVSQCNGTCVNGLSTQLPVCQCDAGFPSPCETLASGGECRGDVLLHCLNGVLEGINCQLSEGLKCIDSDEGAGCGTVGSVNTCGALVHGDACEGNTWVRCEGGVVEKLDCSEDGLLCGWDPAEEVLGCLQE